jgi:hypothetical protein
MWNLYARDGVAIRSTFRRLCESLEKEASDVPVGLVAYLDYIMEQPATYGNTLAPIFSKRREFEHEREVPLVLSIPRASSERLSAVQLRGLGDAR